MADDNITLSVRQRFQEALDDISDEDKGIWKKTLEEKIKIVNSYYLQLKEFQRLKREEAKRQLLNQWNTVGDFQNKIIQLEDTIKKLNLKQPSQIFTEKGNLRQKYKKENDFRQLIMDQLKQLQQSSEVLKKAYENSGIIQEFNEGNASAVRRDMERKLKTAILDLYKYLHQIGEQIKIGTIYYHIIVEATDNQGNMKLLEGNIPLDKLEEYLEIEGRSNDYSLRLKASISQLEGNGLEQVTGNNLNIYRALKQNSDYTKNLGNFGEFYRYIINREIDINNTTKLLQILRQIRKNTANFMTPDIITNLETGQGEEVKAIIGQRPTFLSVEAVLNQAAQFLAILQRKIKDKAENKEVRKIIQETRNTTITQATAMIINKIQQAAKI